eukprot:11633181-Alexandrium_andersonii.AAC.1
MRCNGALLVACCCWSVSARADGAEAPTNAQGEVSLPRTQQWGTLKRPPTKRNSGHWGATRSAATP